MADDQLDTHEDLELQAAIAMSLGQDVSGGKRGADGEPEEAGGGPSDADSESASKSARVGTAQAQVNRRGASSSASAAATMQADEEALVQQALELSMQGSQQQQPQQHAQPQAVAQGAQQESQSPAGVQPAATPPPVPPAFTPPQPQGGSAAPGHVSDLASAFLQMLQNSGGAAGGSVGGSAAPPSVSPQTQPPGDLLQALLNGLPGGGLSPGGMPAIPGVAAPPGGRRGGSRRSHKQRARPPATPQWITDFLNWQLPLHAPQDSVAIPADRTQATSTLKAIFGVEFHPVGDGAPTSDSVPLTMSADGTMSRALAMHALKSALTRMRARGKNSGQGPLEMLSASFARAQTVSDADATFVAFWMDMMACAVLEKLQADAKDDLYFAGGRDRLTFRNLLASGHLPQPLLARCVDLSHSALGGGAPATEMWEEILTGAFNDMRKFEFTSAESAASLNQLLAPLAAMTNHPPLLRIVAMVLLREVVEINAPTAGKGGAAGSDGGLNTQAWERNALMAPLLSITTYLDPARARKACQGAAVDGPLPAALMEVVGYPRNRNAAKAQLQAAQHSLQQANAAAHAILKRIATAKTFSSPAHPAPPGTPPLVPGTGREICLAWLAAAMHACEARTAGGEKAVLHPEYINLGCSDGFALGVSAVALQFVTPVLNKLDAAPAEMLPKLMPAETLPAMSRRLGNLMHARRLAAPDDSAPDAAEGDADGDDEDSSAPRPPSQSGATPVFSCAAEKPGGAAGGAAPVAATAAGSSGAASAPKPLEAPGFAVECVYLAIRGLQVGLLPAMHRMNELMHTMNRYVSQAMAAAGPDAVDRRGMPLPDSPAGILMDKTITVEDCLKAALLTEAPAVTATRMLGLVLTIVWKVLEASDARQAAAVPEPMVRDVVNYASFVISSGAPDLFAASKDLHASMSALAMILRSKLVTSAMTRSSIVDLMRAMLQGTRTPSRGAPLTPPPMSPGAAALTEAVFQTVSAAGVVPALMVAYSEADAVEGLDVDKYHFDKFTMRHNVDTVLRALWRDDRCLMDLMAMAAPDHPQRQVFLDFAKALLNDLSYLMEDSFDRIADVQAISAIKGDEAQWAALPAHEKRTKESFLQSQIGTASGFMRMAMSTVSLILSLVQHAPIRALFLEPARAAHCAHLCMHLIQQLLVRRDGGSDLTSCTEVRWQPNDVLASLAQVLTNLAVDPSFAKVAVAQTSFSEKVLGGAVARLQGLEREIQMAGAYADALQDLLAACLALRAASVGGKGSAVTDALALSVPEVSQELEAEYVAAVQPHAYGTFDHTAQGAYMYELAKRAKASSGGGARARQKKLMKELRGMQAEGGLPVASGASVFVRSAEERLDVVRACITGPQDTPYAYGMFFFDVLFPQDYPNIPPLMLLETTGGGRVRFNPNLYADGKVCLSLLGTWHGSEHEKWNPSTSSLWQVLVSVQAMVFVSDPYFNEPNVEQMRNQTEGINASKSLNSVLSINTIQWAMVDVLKNPKPGFEDAVKAHFLALRPTILRNCQKWLQEIDDSGEQGQLNRERMAGVILELNELLHALG